MNRIVINLEALRHNLDTVNGWVAEHGGSLTVVTKALCGSREIIAALQSLGARSLGDSRIRNLMAIDREPTRTRTWYLRPAHMSAVEDIVSLADVSLNSEMATLEALDAAARRLGRCHDVVIMVEMGDLREGVLPGALTDFYARARTLSHVRVIGIGSNLGCLSGAVPGQDQLQQLALFHELLELKFHTKLPFLSAGTSAALPLLMKGRIPAQVNHFRVGESLFLGTDLLHGGTLPGLRDDAAILEAEVIEIKEKSLTPSGEIGDLSPFAQIDRHMGTPGRRGYRALVTVGHVDTHVESLRPMNPAHRIAGATSDITVLNLDAGHGLSVGDIVRFRLDYASFVRLMANPYTAKVITREAQRRMTPASLPAIPMTASANGLRAA